MSSMGLTAAGVGGRADTRSAPRHDHQVMEAIPAAPQNDALAIVHEGVDKPRERFLPLTRFALLDRLTFPAAWPDGQAQEVRRFFRFLDYWRQQQYGAHVLELEQDYEPFSPDTDLLLTRKFSAAERSAMQRRVVDRMRCVLKQANYERIDPHKVEVIMTTESHYGLDLVVDMGAFEEIEIWYRGASKRRDERRQLKRFFRKEEFDVPIFQRLFLLFKLKPLEKRVAEEMMKANIPREEAEKRVKRMRAMLPPQVREGNIYMKLFKNIPRTDLEMVFPNTEVRFRMFDKLKLGLSASGGLGVGAFGAAGKIAMLASNPVGAAGAVFALGGVVFRQAVAFMNQKQRYMVVMAKNLYFHSMADNRGVMLKLANRAAEEDVKEEMLLYTVLAKEKATRADLTEIDHGIERWLSSAFGITVDFDLHDALERLIADGIVTEQPDGTLLTLPPRQAALHIDTMWDRFLDHLPDAPRTEGVEFDGADA